MTVKELIEILAKMPLEKDVILKIEDVPNQYLGRYVSVSGGAERVDLNPPREGLHSYVHIIGNTHGDNG